MTDWSRLDDAYGPADDIPVLFGNLAAENRRDTWNALWSRLCHQGSAWSATWAAVPLLWRIATQGAPEDKIQAVWMARTIVQAATYQAEGVELNRHKSLFKDFADAADNHLQAHPEAPGYIRTMQAMLALAMNYGAKTSTTSPTPSSTSAAPDVPPRSASPSATTTTTPPSSTGTKAGPSDGP